MNKNILTWAILITFITGNIPSLVRADAPGIQMETLSETSTPAASESGQTSADVDMEEDATPQGTAVSPSDNSTQKRKNKEFWNNIIIAGVAVVVAVVSILAVSNNNGRKH